MPRIEIAAKRAQTGGPIVAAAAVNPNSVAPGFATQFCDVEVDPDTAPDLAKGAAMSRNTSVASSASLMLSTMLGAGVHAEGVCRTRAQASVAEADAFVAIWNKRAVDKALSASRTVIFWRQSFICVPTYS